ncbi:CreA family protein [Aeromonas simiae]|uniref:CreA family protein n=1 Tax=Aeromonas simiae TaxID=218936 RepID=UPI00266B6661|nr:CreA family protein [Aeromonas simiae]MDO2949265.1 CreA family protein [Aeromonas simiae]MDO2952729.1 CreA family protein [Aeromonas simiae]MDO2956486.1 CreA family protein [Aeromonas simiae]
MRQSLLLVTLLCAGAVQATDADRVGEVSTAFKLFGPNHKIVIEAFDDPRIKGVTCYLARPKTGGIKGGLGLAEDPSHATLSCHQVGPITLPAKLKESEEVFDVSTSLVFKEQRVVRFYDARRNALVYLTYSTKLVDGSYKSAVSAVPIMPWG